MSDSLVIIPTYNERENIENIIRKVFSLEKDFHVLVVEDIVDTGHTLEYLIGMLESHLPASVRTCALVRKAERAEVDVDVDYLGFDIGDEWVVGYGLDYAEQNRTLPYIGIVMPDD